MVSEPQAAGPLIDAYLFARPSGVDSTPDLQNSIVAAFATAATSGSLFSLDDESPTSFLSPEVAHITLRSSKPSPDLRALRQSETLSAFEISLGVELVLLPTPSTRPRPVKLAVFDMDSTLIDQEVIDELARTIGKTEYVAAITERAMRGELDFAASLRERVTMLRGVRADVWEALKGVITFAPGARTLCAALKQAGVRMAVLSGGFQPMAEYVKAELGLDVAVANHLVTSPPTPEVPHEHLTGELNPEYPIIGAAKKRELLEALAKEHGIPLSEVLCVGDGANDLDMLGAVGEGGGVAVACRAKPKVQSEAPNKLNKGSLADLLYLFDLQPR